MRSPHCLLGQLPPAVGPLWLPHIRERSLAKGQILQTQDSIAHEFQVIKLGFVLAMRRGDDDVARPVALLGNGHALGSPGWRMYYIQRADILIVMLGGGDKAGQEQDIAAAQALAREINL